MAKVVLRLGDDVSTDAIYPGRFMATVLPTETPQYCFADLTDFNKRLKDGAVPPGSVVVADRNFGTGSSREQAASCLKGWDLVIVANNYSRIFLQNAVNLGLRLVICPDRRGFRGRRTRSQGRGGLQRDNRQELPGRAAAACPAGHRRCWRLHPLHPQAGGRGADRIGKGRTWPPPLLFVGAARPPAG